MARRCCGQSWEAQTSQNTFLQKSVTLWSITAAIRRALTSSDFWKVKWRKTIPLGLGGEHLFLKYSKQILDQGMEQVERWTYLWYLNATVGNPSCSFHILSAACLLHHIWLGSYNWFWIDLVQGSSVVLQGADILFVARIRKKSRDLRTFTGRHYYI